MDNIYPQTLSQNDILKILNLSHADIKTIDVTHTNDGLVVNIELNVKPHPCPICSVPTTKVKGYQLKKIKHSVINNVPCTIHYKARRYLCPLCNRSFMESNPFAVSGSNISTATVYNVLRDLKDPAATFFSVSQRYSLSPSTVAYLFDRYIRVPRRQLPVCLSLDETYAFKSEKSDYVCVLIDYIEKKIVDLLPSRRKEDLIKYFYKIPEEERRRVKYVSMDMWFTYRDVAKLLFPNCITIVDKFHVLQDLTRRVKNVRTRIMKRYKSKCDKLQEEAMNRKKEHKQLSSQEQEQLHEAQINYYLLKKFDWLLFSNNKKIYNPNENKKYNRVLGRYCNLYDLMDMIENIDPELKEALELKDLIYDFYKNCDYEHAKTELNEIIVTLRQSKVEELAKFANTLTQWYQEVVNSFIIIDEINKKINNAFIENRNRTIKLIKHSSNGYHNWERFRARVLYCLNDDVIMTIQRQRE